MLLYRRHLPHWIPNETVLFVTWRLAGSYPPTPDSPRWLADGRVAELVAEAIAYGNGLRYRLYAWVNHVHAVFEPLSELSAIMHWLKGRTARKANRILGRTGPFWQDESYDRWIRDSKEFYKTIAYVEENPVRAGLVQETSQWRWSSAWQTVGQAIGVSGLSIKIE